MPDTAYGFRPNRSTRDAGLLVRTLLEEATNPDTPAKDPMVFLLFDIKKAYPNVPRDLLWVIMSKFGIPASLIKSSAGATHQHALHGTECIGRRKTIQVAAGSARRVPQQLCAVQPAPRGNYDINAQKEAGAMGDPVLC